MSFKIFSISNSHSQREEAIFSKDIRKIIVCQGRFIHISHSQPCMGFGKKQFRNLGFGNCDDSHM